ncbi:MAG: S8 family serine peptidase [Muribaculaceae bacterium]|nr:S8 family serine peptidase [Muribaculaceae bacterium]
MRKSILFACAAAIIAANAQNKININGLFRLQELRSEKVSRAAMAEPIEAIATMNPGWTTEGFEALGAKVVDELDDTMIIISVPAENMEAWAALPQVYYVEFGNEYHLSLDFARPASTVTEAQSGIEFEGSTVAYDGTGVVTGLMDTGIDPNHVNFLGADGRSRVKEAYDYTSKVTAVTPEQVSKFTTDTKNESHGTHVAGIMAGSYNGPGEALVTNSATSNTGKTLSTIPYYGVATNSDIVMTSGTLSDANIIKGVRAIIAYAEAEGMPAVVNLSLGSNNGPHDGTGSLERSLATQGKKAIICIAAGNEGENNMYVGKKFTATDNVLKTFVLNNRSSGIDIWASDKTPLKVTVADYETSTGKFTTLSEISAPGGTTSPSNFSTLFSGQYSILAEVNKVNNRYHVEIGGTFSPNKGGHNVAIFIEGVEGQSVSVYGYGNSATSFTSNSISGFTNGTKNGTISNLACANNVIAIGAYTTRTHWNTFGGNYRYNGNSFKVGEISPFSSFGSTFQGVNLPIVCAPGANIISSLNRYYTSALSATTRNRETSASAEQDGSTMINYWGAMQGTSMACPYAAGVVALWLQADPTLTVEDVIDIMKKTSGSQFDDSGFLGPATGPSDAEIQWGAGKLDATAGIKEILSRKSSGIEGIVADADSHLFVEKTGEGLYSVSVPGAPSLDVKLFNMQGALVASASATSAEATLDAAHAAPGVYLLTALTPNARPLSLKIVIR